MILLAEFKLFERLHSGCYHRIMSSSNQCHYCNKVFSRSFNLRRHLASNSCKMSLGTNRSYDTSSDDEEMHSNTETSDDVSIEDNDQNSHDSSQEDFSSDSSDSDSEDESTESAEIPWYWKILIDEAADRNSVHEKEIVSDDISYHNAQEHAHHDKMLSTLRKDLRNILVERLEWMYAIQETLISKR